MSDRGRSRRTARSTKATPPKAASTTPATEAEPGAEPAATTGADSYHVFSGAESDQTPSGAGSSAATPSATTEATTSDVDGVDTGASEPDVPGAADDVPAEPSGDASDLAAESDAAATTTTTTDEDAADVSAEDDTSSDVADASDVDGATDSAADADSAIDDDASAVDGAADDDGDGGTGTAAGKDKAAGKAAKPAKADRTKSATPMTKAEKRAAARIAAAKAARRRRTGQAIAGTLIVLLVVGGAFAGIWYFGDRAAKNKVKCKPVAVAEFPQLLGGMNKGLTKEPTIKPGTEPVNTEPVLLIKGDCKTVKAGQTVVVNYVGATYKDAKVFDSSWPRKKTVEIPVGQKQLGKQQQVIEGWDEGLVGLKVGTRVQLDVPASKAYGDAPPEGYPAGTLRFIIDILDVKDADSGLPAGLGG